MRLLRYSSVYVSRNQTGYSAGYYNGTDAQTVTCAYHAEWDMPTASIPGNSKANVRVRVGRRIVQIERQHARVRAIVPVAAADERASTFRPNNHKYYTLVYMTALPEGSFAAVASIETLVRAHQKSLAGKRSSRTATMSNYHFMSQILEIQHELTHGTYKPSPYRKRLITEPKVRRIEAPAFRDRVVHHALHSVISPFYERHFIYDSYACRPGKGIHRAMTRVQYFLRAIPDAYVCKIDISKYYGTVNHAKLKQLLARRIADQELLRVLDTIISSSHSGTEYDHLFPPDSHQRTKGSRGIPIGNLTSQIFANIYLHEADMYAKHVLKIRHYIRYMDDILLFSSDKKELHRWQRALTEFLYEDLYLTVNPRKVRVYPARMGVDFVGYVLYPHTRRVRASSVRRFRRRFNKKLQGLVAGRTSVESVEASFRAWSAHARHGNGVALIENERKKMSDHVFVWSILRQHRRQLRKRRKRVQLLLLDS